MPQERKYKVWSDYLVSSCVAELFAADHPRKENQIGKMQSTPAIAGRCHSWLNTIALAQGRSIIEVHLLKGFPFSVFCFVFCCWLD
jgi:hypothetical protein